MGTIGAWDLCEPSASAVVEKVPGRILYVSPEPFRRRCDRCRRTRLLRNYSTRRAMRALQDRVAQMGAAPEFLIPSHPVDWTKGPPNPPKCPHCGSLARPGPRRFRFRGVPLGTFPGWRGPNGDWRFFEPKVSRRIRAAARRAGVWGYWRPAVARWMAAQEKAGRGVMRAA